MEKELIINSSPTTVEIALLENSKLVEIHKDKTNSNFTVGDIFIGSVKKLMPGLNAAFVDIGHKKDAFLHYTDLGPKLRSLQSFTAQTMSGSLRSHILDNFTLEEDIIKTGKISQVLKRKQPILVQILKEPISTKGPRLSCEITIPGRFLVLTPFNEVVAVSKKINNAEERKRLRVLVESIKPKNFGLIVRTAAEGKKVAELHDEVNALLEKWETIQQQLYQSRVPAKMLSELDKTSSILRDILSDSFNNIIVNDRTMYNNLKTFLKEIAPQQVGIVKMHRSGTHIFEKHGISRQIKSAFGKTATMPSGAYLVLEETEAMHVVDVNSGPKTQQTDQESSAIAVNLEAAEEIARQLRLRDIGGLIIIDFIDMRNQQHKIKLFQLMRDFMKNDAAQHTILPLSKFGLMQITRERVRPAVKINTSEMCPSCMGTGKINPTILITESIERDLKYIFQSRPNIKLSLEIHPFLYSYLTRGVPSLRTKWFIKYSKWIRLNENSNTPLTNYKFYDKQKDEIKLN